MYAKYKITLKELRSRNRKVTVGYTAYGKRLKNKTKAFNDYKLKEFKSVNRFTV